MLCAFRREIVACILQESLSSHHSFYNRHGLLLEMTHTERELNAEGSIIPLIKTNLFDLYEERIEGNESLPCLSGFYVKLAGEWVGKSLH